jgi:hypothetical protein
MGCSRPGLNSIHEANLSRIAAFSTLTGPAGMREALHEFPTTLERDSRPDKGAGRNLKWQT